MDFLHVVCYLFKLFSQYIWDIYNENFYMLHFNRAPAILRLTINPPNSIFFTKVHLENTDRSAENTVVRTIEVYHLKEEDEP